MKYESKKGMPFKPCKGCPTPAKCMKAGKCLMDDEEDMDEKDEKKAYKTIGKMAKAMGLKK